MNSRTNEATGRRLRFSDAVEVNPKIKLERGTSYPFVSMSDITPKQKVVLAQQQREYKGTGSKFQSGDVLLARITPCLENGKLATYRLDGGDEIYAHGSTEFIVLRGRPDLTHTDYVYYMCRTAEFRLYAESQMTGTSGRQRVPTDSLGYLRVQIPTMQEQEKIVEYIGSLDSKIEQNRRITATLESIGQEIFSSWFVHFEPVKAKQEGRWKRGETLSGLPAKYYDRFPSEFVSTKLGLIPSEWRIGAMDEIAKHTRSTRNPQLEPETEFLHYSIPAYDLDQSPVCQIGKDILSQKHNVVPNVVLVSKLNPDIKRVWLIGSKPGNNAVCSPEFLTFEARLPFKLSYLYFLVRSKSFQEMMQSLATGTSKSHQRANVGSILAFNTVLPDASSIDAFDAQVSAMLQKCEDMRWENRLLSQLRDGLIARLISGNVDI